MEKEIMSTPLSGDSAVSTQTSALADSSWRGLLIGLIPLGLLIVLVAITIALTALARQLFVGSGFFAQQQASLIVLIAGLLLACAIYVVALWRTLHRVGIWQQEEKRVQASAALWALGATALIVIIPVLLAVLLPQHPAP
jgi:hypothetical protein